MDVLNKIEEKADWAAALASAYFRIQEDNLSVGDIIANALPNLQASLTPGGLEWKLWKSPHLFTLLFKAGVLAYLGSDFGLIGAKWKNIGAKVAKGAGAAALVLPGSEIGAGFNQNPGNGQRERWRNY